MQLQPIDNGFGGGDVRRERDAMDIADAHQRGNIRFVRLRGQRIAEEKDRFDSPLGDTSANDEVPAVRTVRDALDLQADFRCDASTGTAGRNKRTSREEVAMSGDESGEIILLAIMRNQGEHALIPAI